MRRYVTKHEDTVKTCTEMAADTRIRALKNRPKKRGRRPIRCSRVTKSKLNKLQRRNTRKQHLPTEPRKAVQEYTRSIDEKGETRRRSSSKFEPGGKKWPKKKVNLHIVREKNIKTMTAVADKTSSNRERPW